MSIEWNQDELLRYQRHFPVIGLQGQEQLKAAKVLCVGAGGLGCPVLQYLAAAGIGTLGIVDGDQIDISNLQRQILFNTSDLGRYKAEVAQERLMALNPNVTVHHYCQFLNESDAACMIQNYDVVIDATDNYEARYLLNRYCRELKKPLISASIYQYDAQMSVFNYENGPCYQCLYESPPPEEFTPNCALGGVLGVLPGIMGTLQANEVIKIILKAGHILSGEMLSLDLLSMRFHRFEIPKKECHQHPHITFGNAPKISCGGDETISAEQLVKKIQDVQLIDVRESYERQICHIGGIHIPLANLESSLGKINFDHETVIYCRSGVRSEKAYQILKKAGLKKLSHLENGILGWIENIDSSLTRY